MEFNIFNPSPRNNPFLHKDESQDDLHAEWNRLIKDWAEIEKENKLLDIYSANSINGLY